MSTSPKAKRKAAKACIEGITCIGIGGVNSYAAKKKVDAFLLPDLTAIGWKGRKAILVFDSDSDSKQTVRDALIAFGRELTKAGTRVFSIQLPVEASKKTGLDDFLIEQGFDAFRTLDAERQELDFSSQLWAFNSQYCFNRDPNNVSIIDKATGVPMSEKDFGSRERNRRIIVRNNAGNLIEVSAAEVWCTWSFREEVDGMIFDPSQKHQIVYQGAKRLFNTYVGWPIRPISGSVEPWIEAFNHVFARLPSGRKGRDYVLAWLADIIQNPGQRQMVALLIIGLGGIGKSFLFELFGACLGNGVYYRKINNKSLHSEWTSWRRNLLFAQCEEVTMRGDRVNVRDADFFKDAITGETKDINEKYGGNYQQASYEAFLFLSNYSNPMLITPDDRRYFVYNAGHTLNLPHVERMSKELVARLQRWRDEENGIAKLLEYFLTYKIPAWFDRTDPAPDTQDKVDVAEAVALSYEENVQELMTDPPNGRVLWRWEELVNFIEPGSATFYNPRDPYQKIREALCNAGAYRNPNKITLGKGKNIRKVILWAVGPNVELWKKAPNQAWRAEWDSFERGRNTGVPLDKPATVIKGDFTGQKKRAFFK